MLAVPLFLWRRRGVKRGGRSMPSFVLTDTVTPISRSSSQSELEGRTIRMVAARLEKVSRPDGRCREVPTSPGNAVPPTPDGVLS